MEVESLTDEADGAYCEYLMKVVGTTAKTVLQLIVTRQIGRVGYHSKDAEMHNQIIDEERCLIFIRSALEVSTSNYEAIVLQRSAGVLPKATAKSIRMQREIEDIHSQLGNLIGSNRDKWE